MALYLLLPHLSQLSACPGGFLCDDGDCISTTDQCDGNNDCADGSDEDNCFSSMYVYTTAH